jgi:hypothetical protein
MLKVAARATELTIPSDALAAVEAQQTRWNTAFALAEDPSTRTKGAVKEKQEARNAYEVGLRKLIRTYLMYSPVLTDQDREDMGLPVHKTTRTRAPVASNAPFVAAAGHGPRVVRVDFGESPTSAAKPAGQHCVELASVIAETRPTEIDDLIRSVVNTRTPLLLTFKESERGKMLWFAARWENTRGEKGPWSEIQSAIIP